MNVKKIAKAMLAVSLAFSMISVPPAIMDNDNSVGIVAYAASEYKTTNGFVLSKDSEGNIYVSDYKGKGGSIIIPKEATYIGESAFKNNTSITSVTFPAGTTKNGIGNEAFAWCTSLTTVTIKGDVGTKSVNGIGGGAFKGCHQLKTVTFSDKKAHLAYIGEYAFLSCYALTSINLPTDTEVIYESAFQNCASLSSIIIPKKTKIEGSYTFGYMYGADTPDDYYDNHYNGNSKKIKDVKATGSKSVCWEISARTEPEASRIAKAVFGNSAGLRMYSFDDDESDGITFDEYSFCYPIKQKQITLKVYSGSNAEKWAKANKISYKLYSGTSTTTGILDAPANLDATKTKNSVTLVWDEVSGASAYKVYKYDSKTKKYVAYKTVKSEMCKITKLSAGTKYKFKVVALKKSGNKYKAGEYATISVTTKK